MTNNIVESYKQIVKECTNNNYPVPNPETSVKLLLKTLGKSDMFDKCKSAGFSFGGDITTPIGGANTYGEGSVQSGCQSIALMASSLHRSSTLVGCQVVLNSMSNSASGSQSQVIKLGNIELINCKFQIIQDLRSNFKNIGQVDQTMKSTLNNKYKTIVQQGLKSLNDTFQEGTMAPTGARQFGLNESSIQNAQNNITGSGFSTSFNNNVSQEENIQAIDVTCKDGRIIMGQSALLDFVVSSTMSTILESVQETDMEIDMSQKIDLENKQKRIAAKAKAQKSNIIIIIIISIAVLCILSIGGGLYLKLKKATNKS